jgi:hypothetical protein
MNENLIPEDLRRFIIMNIDSVAELECLLLFQKNPAWRADSETIARKLYLTEEEAQSILSQLHSRKLLESTNDEKTLYFYKNSELISRLAVFYTQYLVPITNLIHSKPKNKVQKFADAFWIRKD